jgi:hypothetical protein
MSSGQPTNNPFGKTGTLAVAVVALVVGLFGPAQAAPQQGRMTIGVSLPTYHYSTATIAAWEKAVRGEADVVQTFVGWEYTGQPTLNQFPYSRAKEIASMGSLLEVTWGPSKTGDPLTREA